MPNEEDEATQIGQAYTGGNDATQMGAAVGSGPSEVRGKLVCVAGQAAGQTFDLSDGKTVFGRGQAADVKIHDIGISRTHLELDVQPGLVRARDMDSGNGTTVNGEPITQVMLTDGDEVQIGDHIFRFEDAMGGGGEATVVGAQAFTGGGGGGPAPTAMMPAASELPAVPSVRSRRRQSQQPEKKGGKGGLIIVLLLLVIVGGGGAYFMKMKKADAPPPKDPTAGGGEAAAGPADPRQVFREGMDLFRKKDYAAALTKFEEAAALDPEHAKTQQYLGATQHEIEGQKAIGDAKQKLAGGDYAGARQALAAIDPDSLSASDAKPVEQEIDRAEADALVSQGNAALNAISIPTGGTPDTFDQLGNLIESLGPIRAKFIRAQELAPGHPGADAGISAVRAKDDALGNAMKANQRAYKAYLAKKKAQEIQDEKNRIRAALAPGVKAFDNRDFDAANAHFQKLASGGDAAVAKQARPMAAASKDFGGPFKKGVAAADAKKTDDAVRALEPLLGKAAKIAPGGKVHTKIKTELGKMLYLQGRVAFNGRKFSVSYDAWSRAAKYDPSNDMVRDGMGDLEMKAKEVYQTAYVQRTLNKATAKRGFKQVLGMTPASSEWHQKAEQRLGELGGP